MLEEAGDVFRRRRRLHARSECRIRKRGKEALAARDRWAESLLLGSETQKVLTHCKIPVLVYR